jgi:hypothetical protein
VGSARRRRSGRNIHNDHRGSWKLRLKISDFLVLDKINPHDLLYHEHNLRGITIAAKSDPEDAKNLLQDEVKDREVLLLHIELNQVPLILGAGSSISNSWSQGGPEKMVKSVEIGNEVLHLWWMSHGTRSIHKVHLIWLDNIERRTGEEDQRGDEWKPIKIP